MGFTIGSALGMGATRSRELYHGDIVETFNGPLALFAVSTVGSRVKRIAIYGSDGDNGGESGQCVVVEDGIAGVPPHTLYLTITAGGPDGFSEVTDDPEAPTFARSADAGRHGDGEPQAGDYGRIEITWGE